MTDKQKRIKQLLQVELRDVDMRRRLFLARLIVDGITSNDLFGFQDGTIPTPYVCQVGTDLRDMEKKVVK